MPISTVDAGAGVARRTSRPGARYSKIGAGAARLLGGVCAQSRVGVVVQVVRRAVAVAAVVARRRALGSTVDEVGRRRCAAVTPALPPLHANSGAFRRAEQVDVLGAAGADRADRVGVLRVEHRGEAGEPPSTISSNTMSAWLSPVCGRASMRCRSSPPAPGGRRVLRRIGERHAGERHRGRPAPASWSAPSSSVGGRRRRCRRGRRWRRWSSALGGRRWSATVGGRRRRRRRRGAAAGDAGGGEQQAADARRRCGDGCGTSAWCRAHSSLSRLIRSSSGGCVSNSWWIDPSRPWSPTPLIGCSIHKCAVAVDAECVTVVSSRNFSSAEIRPGGYRVSWHALTSASVSRLPRDRRLHRLGDDRGEDQQDEADDGQRVAAVVVVAVAALATAVPPHRADRDVGDEGDRADQRDGQRRHEDVVVADVRQLVGDARPRARRGSSSRAARW